LSSSHCPPEAAGDKLGGEYDAALRLLGLDLPVPDHSTFARWPQATSGWIVAATLTERGIDDAAQVGPLARSTHRIGGLFDGGRRL
jgi:hypothetical protein